MLGAAKHGAASAATAAPQARSSEIRKGLVPPMACEPCSDQAIAESRLSTSVLARPNPVL